MYKSKLGKIAAELLPVVDAALVQAAQEIADDASRRLEPHRRTGELAREVHVDAKQREGVYVVAGDPKDPHFAFWGHMLEHGTSHSPAFPFLVPALEDNHDRVHSLIAAAVAKASS